MESSAVLPLSLLNPDTNIRHLGAPDAAASISHHCGGDSTPYISTCTGVGLPPLCGNVAVQALQHGLRLCAHHAVEIDNGQGKVAPLLQTRVNLLVLLFPFRHLQALLQRLL